MARTKRRWEGLRKTHDFNLSSLHTSAFPHCVPTQLCPLHLNTQTHRDKIEILKTLLNAPFKKKLSQERNFFAIKFLAIFPHFVRRSGNSKHHGYISMPHTCTDGESTPAQMGWSISSEALGAVEQLDEWSHWLNKRHLTVRLAVSLPCSNAALRVLSIGQSMCTP